MQCPGHNTSHWSDEDVAAFMTLQPIHTSQYLHTMLLICCFEWHI